MRRWRLLLGVPALCVLASGCISQQQVTTSQTQSAAAVVSRAPSPVGPATPAQPSVISGTVAAGITTNIDFSYDLNPDCSVRSIPSLRVVQNPAHGTVSIVARQGLPTFSPENIHFACNTVKVSGMALDYKPDANFIGADFFVFESINGGRDQTLRIAVTVK